MQKIKTNKGITLIALVITIIILLILAGIALSQFIGHDGLLSRSRQTRTAQSDAQIMDAMSLIYTEYNMEKALGETDAEFIAYMQDRGFVSADGTVNTVSFIGNKIELGNGTDKKDTYVLEKKDDKYVINYYDEDGEKQKEVWNADSTGDSSTGVTKRDENMFDFDPTTGTILRVKEEYLVDYYNYKNWYTYLDSDYKWCKIEDGIDTLVIPNSINGVAVKKVASLGVVNVKNIIIEEGIEEINGIGSAGSYYGDETYYRDSELKNISIPSSVTSIGDYAFSKCPNLIKINIPASVTNIGSNAFAWCAGLTSIDIPTSVTSIGSYAFEACTGLTSIDISANVTKIKDGTFYGCTNLASANIPTSVTSIESYAFEECTGLTNINISTSVTSIEVNAFRGCTGLMRINVEEGNTIYDSRDNCNAIIETNSNKLMIGCKGTVIPTSVTSIGSNAFERCSSLTNINIPSSVTSIKDGAFNECTGLTSINIPISVTSIEGSAFRGCTGLTSINIPSSVTNIENYVFIGWTSSQTINCQAASKPSGWGSDWDYYSDAKVNWGVSM